MQIEPQATALSSPVIGTFNYEFCDSLLKKLIALTATDRLFDGMSLNEARTEEKNSDFGSELAPIARIVVNKLCRQLEIEVLSCNVCPSEIEGLIIVTREFLEAVKR